MSATYNIGSMVDAVDELMKRIGQRPNGSTPPFLAPASAPSAGANAPVSAGTAPTPPRTPSIGAAAPTTMSPANPQNVGAIPSSPDFLKQQQDIDAAKAGVTMPNKADYQPSTLRKIGAIAAGVGTGLLTRNPGVGWSIGSRIENAPYEKAVEGYNTQMAPITQRQGALTAEEQAFKDQQAADIAAANANRAGQTINVTLPDGSIIPMTPKEAEDYQKAKEGNATKQNIANAHNVNETELHQMDDANKLAIASGKAQPTKVLMQADDKPHVMERDPSTGQYSIDRGIAPANYAQVATSLRDVTIMGDNGLPVTETQQQFLNQGGVGTAASKEATAAQGVQGDVNYAQTYQNGGQYTGPGDELLMESFFDLAKPSSGFRMTQQQIDLLLKSRSWMDSAEGIAYHAKTGVWFPPDQRKQIVDSMVARQESKASAVTPTGPATAAPPPGKGPAPFDPNAKYKAGDTFTQGGFTYTVKSVDANGRVTEAN